MDDSPLELVLWVARKRIGLFGVFFLL